MPVAVGVPERTPVAALKVRPGGTVPAERLSCSGVVPPEAAKVVVYGTPTTPAGGVPVITGSGLTVMVTLLLTLVPGSVAVSTTFMGAVSPAGAV